MSDYNRKGRGVAFKADWLGGKKHAARLKNNIEVVVTLSKRREKCETDCDWQGLREVATEYSALGATATANEIYRSIPHEETP